uniref:Uncharacterized protein n=1 Tax=Octopus bimaculoides TaxID=37653 RepID=A0A0L8G2A5_OCTBM
MTYTQDALVVPHINHKHTIPLQTSLISLQITSGFSKTFLFLSPGSFLIQMP